MQAITKYRKHFFEFYTSLKLSLIPVTYLDKYEKIEVLSSITHIKIININKSLKRFPST